MLSCSLIYWITYAVVTVSSFLLYLSLIFPFGLTKKACSTIKQVCFNYFVCLLFLSLQPLEC